VDLNNSFIVDVPVERAWEVLTDVPMIAPCLPGAQLQDVDGDEYKGIVKVKVGPIVTQYKGAATFVEQDATAHRIVLEAEGRETRGQGNAKALITATLEAKGGSTEVVVTTDLKVTGKVAQFGRGVMADVSAKLMDQFAENLAAVVSADPTAAASEDGSGNGSSNGSGSGAAGAPASGKEAPPVLSTPRADPEPIDLLQAAGAPTAQRLVPPIIAAVVALLVIRIILRRRKA